MVIIQPQALAVEFLARHMIFFLEGVDHVGLVLVQAARERDHKEPKRAQDTLRIYRVWSKNSK
jgi:hypothetical protein